MKQWSVLLGVNVLFFLHLLLYLVFYQLLDLLHLQVNLRLSFIRITLNLEECVTLVHFLWSQFLSCIISFWQLTRSQDFQHSLKFKLHRHFLNIYFFLSTFEWICFVLLRVKHCRRADVRWFSQRCHHYHLLGSLGPSFNFLCLLCSWKIELLC